MHPVFVDWGKGVGVDVEKRLRHLIGEDVGQFDAAQAMVQLGGGAIV